MDGEEKKRLVLITVARDHVELTYKHFRGKSDGTVWPFRYARGLDLMVKSLLEAKDEHYHDSSRLFP